MRTFSSAVGQGKTALIWNERTSPLRATSAGAAPVMSSPLYVMVPLVAGRKRVSRLKQVVLPAPFGPISAWMVPRITRRSTRFTAMNPRNSFDKPRVSRITSESGTRLHSRKPNRRASAGALERCDPVAASPALRLTGRVQPDRCADAEAAAARADGGPAQGAGAHGEGATGQPPSAGSWAGT